MSKDISKLIGLPNIVKELDDETLAKIAENVETGFDIDNESRADWEKQQDEATKLAEQVWEKKNFPFENASNVKYPLIATSTLQFSARAYPTFIKGPNVVKGLVIGDDPQGAKAEKAENIGTHMSYQCLHEMEEWEEDTDKLLTNLPVVGCAFKKTFFNRVLQRNVSLFRRAKDIVINFYAKSLETAPRVSDVFTLYPNEIEERIRAEMFIDFKYGSSVSTKEENQPNVSTDPDQEHVFYEQHTWYDLDDDGYKEPYIITFHKDTKTVVRMLPRFDFDSVEYDYRNRIVKITPDHYFTKFPFLPSISGGIYDAGFGLLLHPINSTINSLINQINDSGTLYNLNAGFIGKGIQLGRGRGGGRLEFQPGEWKHVNFTGDDIRRHILPLPAKEPSLVLFNMLGFMVQAGERLSSVTEILTGAQSNEAERPTTTLARIEQGLKVFSSIHKRLYRSFRQEYKKLFELNRKYLKPMNYYRVLDKPMLTLQSDYDYKSCDVVPIADPNEATNTEKMIRAQIWMGVRGQGFNDDEIRKRFAEGMQEPEPEKLLKAPEPPPDPKTIIEQEKLKLDWEKFKFEVVKFGAESEERKAKIANLLAKATDAMAKAESYEVGQQLEIYKTQLGALVEEFKVENANRQTGLGAVEGGQGNAGSVSNTP